MCGVIQHEAMSHGASIEQRARLKWTHNVANVKNTSDCRERPRRASRAIGCSCGACRKMHQQRAVHLGFLPIPVAIDAVHRNKESSPFFRVTVRDVSFFG